MVIGAGDATGGAVARRFAREGYVTCVTRRTADNLQPLLESIRADGGIAHGFGSDARIEEEVIKLVDDIEATLGAIEVLVFNVGANSRSSILTETTRRYTKMWEMACLAGFLNGREVSKRMVAREIQTEQKGVPHRGTIIFTGATASLRGSPNFAGFSQVFDRKPNRSIAHDQLDLQLLSEVDGNLTQINEGTQDSDVLISMSPVKRSQAR